jgi:hypothetical protein
MKVGFLRIRMVSLTLKFLIFVALLLVSSTILTPSWTASAQFPGDMCQLLAFGDIGSSLDGNCQQAMVMISCYNVFSGPYQTITCIGETCSSGSVTVSCSP